MLTSTQQIFKSFNCPKCDTPYSKTAGAENTPTSTICPNKQEICMGCYKKQRKTYQGYGIYERVLLSLGPTPVLGRVDRPVAHQCGAKRCFDREPTPSYYLMELLSSGAFKLDRQGKGYVQTTQSITIPECPVCHQKYSLRDAKKEPCILHCGHTVCNECFYRRAQRGFSCSAHKCPLCQANSFHIVGKAWGENRLKTFLRELEEKSTQKEAEMKSICEDCGKEVSLLEMFQCMDCGGKMLCSRCVCKNHHPHQIIDLEVVETKKLEQVTRETIIPQIEVYNVCFPELQANLIKNFNECQKKILSRTDQLGYLNGFAEVNEQQKACMAFGERFETICEKYLGELRSFNTGIEKLIDDINESPK